jgi:hypothetical protein
MKGCHPLRRLVRGWQPSPVHSSAVRLSMIESRVDTMAMVCPQCNSSHEQTLHCPSCGVRLLYQSHLRRPENSSAGASGQWLHTAVGRVIAGILLAQGLAYGLQLLCTAGVLATAHDAEQSVWSTLFGLVLLQALQGMSLLIGGGLAGAGQKRAPLLGFVVGLVHGVFFLSIQRLQGAPQTEVTLYGQPILHVMIGIVGAVIGSYIWRPLPTLAMPEFETDKSFQPLRSRKVRFTMLRGPIAWGRVFAGIVFVTAGFLWGPLMLSVMLDASQGKLRVTDHLQAQLVTWEIIAWGTMFGGAIAGATTSNGLKQGLCVGVGASIVLVGNYLGGKAFLLEQSSYIVVTIVCLTIVGGWFGGQLFPPVQAIPRFRSVGAASH